MYILLQTRLGGIGRFQHSGNNVIRYIIGDNKGILQIIELVHGKFRTPKNITFNYLIEFFNFKYNHNIPNSPLDLSDFGNNSWLTGFVEADGYFGVQILESKPKSDTRKRVRSGSINLVFRLDQRSFDTPTNTTFVPFMEKLAKFLDCSVLPYKEDKVLSLSLTSLDKLTNLIVYFDKYPLIGVKGQDFKDWVQIYHMIKNKEHLTETGKERIMLLQSNMNSKRNI
jgi:LAGLIDADG DNA endonuclease family protein